MFNIGINILLYDWPSNMFQICLIFYLYFCHSVRAPFGIDRGMNLAMISMVN